jgi:signal peptidase I
MVKNIFLYIFQTKWLNSALTALLAFVLLKFLVLDLVLVNGKDMSATYGYGDVLLIKKVFNSYKTNDIVYFKYPVKDSATAPDVFFFQRVIGLPGDSISLQGKRLFINGFLITDTITLKNNYFIETRQQALDSAFKLRYGLTEGGQISSNFDYSYSLTRTESELLRKDSLIKKVELKSEKQNNFDETCFPYSVYYPWNMDYYGKIYIPKKNDILKLDSLSLPLYSALIQNYEENVLEVRHDSVFVNDVFTPFYVVHKNYFFVLGDNRDNANDSRVWGFLPEDFIVGKAMARIKQAEK